MDKDLQSIWALLQVLEVSNKYPPLKPLHDQALRELTMFAKDAADAWAIEKVKLEKAAAEEKAEADAKAKAKAEAEARASAPRAIPAATPPIVRKPLPLTGDTV